MSEDMILEATRNEIWAAAYRRAQQCVKMDDSLRARILDACDMASGQAMHAAPARSLRRHLPVHHALAAAAAVCAVALGASAVVPRDTLMNAAAQLRHLTVGVAPEEAAPSFALKAYAAERGAAVGADAAAAGDGLFFVRSGQGPLLRGEEYEHRGYFTGCVMSVEGEGIRTVDVEVDGGIVADGRVHSPCWYTIEARRVSAAEDPKAWEALRAYEGGGIYDRTSPFFPCDELIEAPRGQDTSDVLMLLRQGSTVEGLTPGSGRGVQVGLWTDAPYEGGTTEVLDTFRGCRVGVKVSFDDGHVERAAFTLHAGALELATDDNGEQMFSGIVIDDPDPAGEGKTWEYSLYGTDITVSYPQNASGETYGSINPGLLSVIDPDLVLSATTDGRTGYVRSTDPIHRHWSSEAEGLGDSTGWPGDGDGIDVEDYVARIFREQAEALAISCQDVFGCVLFTADEAIACVQEDGSVGYSAACRTLLESMQRNADRRAQDGTPVVPAVDEESADEMFWRAYEMTADYRYVYEADGQTVIGEFRSGGMRTVTPPMLAR